MRKFHLIKAHTKGDKEIYTLEESYHYYQDAQDEADALNDRNEADWLFYFVSQYLPEEMPDA